MQYIAFDAHKHYTLASVVSLVGLDAATDSVLFFGTGGVAFCLGVGRARSSYGEPKVGQTREADMDVVVRELQPEDVPTCERILLALPEWLGLPEANIAFIESLRRLPAFVVVVEAEIVGFLALETQNAVSAEIRIVAVTPALHRHGVGRALLSRAPEWCTEKRVRWLHVKTRGPSTPDPYYERTRLFFVAQGFDPLFESPTLWGPDDAALVLVQPIVVASLPNSALQPTAPSLRSVRGD